MTNASNIRAAFTTALGALALLLASPAHAKRCADVSMPAKTKVAGKTLYLNGMGIREATVFNVDVYVAGLYVEKRSSKSSTILDESKTKRIVLHFVRDVDRADMRKAINESFTASAGKAGARKMRPGISTLTAGLPSEIKEGTTLMFTYVPGKGLHTHVNGRAKRTIASPEFARTFFNIWLGSKPPNAGLKRGLLGGKCG